MRFQLLAGLLWAVLGLTSLPLLARADTTMNEWNKLMIDQLMGGFNPFQTSRAIAGAHLAQWNAVKAILAQTNLTPDSPNLPISSLLPALKSGVAAAAKTVLVDGRFMNGTAAVAFNALYDRQVDLTQTAAINLGVAAGQAVIAMRLNDGSNATASPFRGNDTLCGAWRSTPNANQSAAMPQWRYVKPWAMETPSQFRLPPPPNFETSTIYREAYDETMRLGRKVSPFRTEMETMIGGFWHLNVQWYTNELVRKLTADYDLVEAARFFVTNAIAFADMQIAGWDNKYEYQFWRPITAIRLGNCVNDPTNFPKDETWTPLLETPNHPEYMAGHAATSAAVLEALRFLNGGDIIPAITITNPMMPQMGGRTFTSLSAMANEIARSRVLAGAHFSFSTKGGQTMGRQVGAYTVKALGVGGCGAGNYAWGGACLPCQMDTYWPSNLFTDSCTPCATGYTSPMGASACVPRLTLALRTNGREFAGEPSGGDDGMGMPMMGMMGVASAASVSSTASSSGSTVSATSTHSSATITLDRKGRGVIQLIQRNPQSAPSGALAVVTLTLPHGVKFAGAARTVSPMSMSGKTTDKQIASDLKKPKIDGQTLTWRFAPLGAGQERTFVVKVHVYETIFSWLSFRGTTYYLTPAGAGAGTAGMDMGGMGMGMSMMYGLTDLTFNVPIR